MAATKLATFMAGLAKDHARMKAFKEDPHGEMAKANLSDVEQLAILSKKPDLISKAIGNPGAAAANADTTVVVVVL